MALLFRVRKRAAGSVRCAVPRSRCENAGIDYGRMAGAVQPQRIVLRDAGESVDGGAVSYAAELWRGFRPAAASDGFPECGRLESDVRRQPRRPAFRGAHRGPRKIRIDHIAHELACGTEKITQAQERKFGLMKSSRRARRGAAGRLLRVDINGGGVDFETGL